jgi:molybdate transport system ATP-binding protein
VAVAETPIMKLELIDVRLKLSSFVLEVRTVLSGKATAIFAPSGAGKTSMIEVIAGIRRPTAGVIRLENRTLTDVGKSIFVPPEERAVGYVPQDGALFPHLSVRENLLFSPASHTDVNNALSFEHVVHVLELHATLRRTISTLSGGERQRVALGRALLCNPKLLLLDEPLAGLDDALKERLLPYLQNVQTEFGIPMLYITHSADEVVALCDEVVLMEHGKIVKQGPPSAIFMPDNRERYRLR